ncbi:MAG: class I SAM-dependent methyltransferase [Candidatus Zixiibacteriota bacterium]|nr:MAG: class I SAM-dependent methyltransferase [candidate division Zixibacteria bacterium]
MKEEYISESEYDSYYGDLCNLRGRIAADLPVRPNMKILDLATGYGYFAVEVARLGPTLKLLGIDISPDSTAKARKHIDGAGLSDRVEILRMDASNMSFPGDTFDMVANFTGLEDVHMTRGIGGIKKTFAEVARVLKPGGYFCLAVMPPEEMETEAQKIEVEVFSFTCHATWLSADRYESMLREAGLIMVGKRPYHAGKKLTPEQARTEIKFACEFTPKIYGIKAASFEEVWNRYGGKIEKHGLGHYSKVVLMTARLDG